MRVKVFLNIVLISWLWNSLTLGNRLGGLVTGFKFSLFKDCTCNSGVDEVPGSRVPDQYSQPVFNYNNETKEVKEADDKDQYKQDEPEVLCRPHLLRFLYFKRGVNKSGV